MENNQGILTISLDFELYWGVLDKLDLDEYGNNIIGVKKAIPSILDVLSKYNIHATWATVGFIFCQNRNELSKFKPEILPSYSNKEYSPYPYISSNNEIDDDYHFALPLINKIAARAGQEIGTHTFSHYYCLEEGQTPEQFEMDLIAAKKIAQEKNITLSSIVFPRNQTSKAYNRILLKHGITSYRGTANHWIYSAKHEAEQVNPVRRALRLLDTCFNITGHHTYRLKECTKTKPFNFPGSRAFRPYSKRSSFIKHMRIKRIKNAMTDAAKHKKIFHLWWHPHDFGSDTDKNIEMLIEVAEHYSHLKEKYGMASLNMHELTQLAYQQEKIMQSTDRFSSLMESKHPICTSKQQIGY